MNVIPKMEELLKQSGGDLEIKEAISNAIEDLQRKIDKVNETNTGKKNERARILWGRLKSRVKKKDRDRGDGTFKTKKGDLKQIDDISSMLTSQWERKTCRRAGLSERNDLERMVVQMSLENFVIARHIKAITDV